MYAIALAASYYRHNRRRSYFVIAHRIAVRMRNHRGLFRERALLAEPKVAFSRAATMRRPRCDTSGVRNHNPTRRKKKSIREDESAKCASCIAHFLSRASSPTRRANLGWSLWLLLQLFSRLWDDTIANDDVPKAYFYHSIAYICHLRFLKILYLSYIFISCNTCFV